MRTITRLTLVLAAAPGVAGAAPKSAGTGGTSVCNEAENSFRGGYTVSGGPVDPNTAKTILGYVAQYTPTADQMVKQYCKGK